MNKIIYHIFDQIKPSVDYKAIIGRSVNYLFITVKGGGPKMRKQSRRETLDTEMLEGNVLLQGLASATQINNGAGVDRQGEAELRTTTLFTLAGNHLRGEQMAKPGGQNKSTKLVSLLY